MTLTGLLGSNSNYKSFQLVSNPPPALFELPGGCLCQVLITQYHIRMYAEAYLWVMYPTSITPLSMDAGGDLLLGISGTYTVVVSVAGCRSSPVSVQKPVAFSVSGTSFELARSSLGVSLDKGSWGVTSLGSLLTVGTTTTTVDSSSLDSVGLMATVRSDMQDVIWAIDFVGDPVEPVSSPPSTLHALDAIDSIVAFVADRRALSGMLV